MLSKTLQDLLARLPEGQDLQFFQLQQALYATRFTGPVTYDYLNGVPRQISLGQPVKLLICQGDPPAPLDIPARSRAG